jgi:hypothetical protein
MRPFLAALAGSLLGVVVAMFVHDVYVARPRDARLLDSVRQIVTDGAVAWPTADAQREKAKEIAKELDASVARSVDGAREALSIEASLIDLRAQVTEGLTLASMHKLALTETYLSNGRWPVDAEEAGLQSAESYASNAVKSIAVEEGGAILIRYTHPFADSASIRLTHTERHPGRVDWACRAEGFDDPIVLPAACR